MQKSSVQNNKNNDFNTTQHKHNMGPYSGVGAYLSKWVLGEGAYSGVGAYSIIYGRFLSINQLTLIKVFYY